MLQIACLVLCGDARPSRRAGPFFSCKDDTLYRMPKAHKRGAIRFFIMSHIYKHGTPRSTLQGVQLIFSG